MKKWIYVSLTVCTVLFIVWSCNNDDDTSTPQVDENSAPTIETTTFEVPEDQTEIGEVSANDEDEDELSFSITENSNGLFVIDQNTGVLALAEGKVLDFEDEAFAEGDPVYTITVQVKDGNEGTASASMTINVNNVNEAPVFTNEIFDFEVSEGIDVNSVIETFIASDPDAEDELGFSISENDNDLFAIDNETGRLTLAEGKSLDFDTAQQHTLTIQVTDKEGLFATQQLTISVTKVDESNESPILKEGQNISVAEDIAPGVGFETAVEAEDPEADELTFEIIEDVSELFAINEDTGVLSLAEGKALDYEDEAFNGEAPEYILTIRVSDGNTFTDGQITITVTDVDEGEEQDENSAPEITNETFDFDVAENSTDETVIVTVTAADPDEDDTLTYAITDESGTFKINAETGQLSLAEGQSLDFEGEVQEYEITVQVTDSAENTVEEPFTINVTDVNEPPELESSAVITVDEDVPHPEVFELLEAIDPEGEDVAFELTDDADGVFQMTAEGAIYLANGQQLDYEELPNLYEITVEISDGTNTAEYTLEIQVQNVNEAPEVEAEITFDNITESINAAANIGVIAATDPDEGDNLTFEIIQNDGMLFEINNNGELSLAENQALDFLTDQVHEITVRVTDEEGLNAETQVTINVIDSFADEDTPFITVWETEGENWIIRIGVVASFNYNFSVDWGDGNIENLDFSGQSTFSHNYENPGAYEVAILGDFPTINMSLGNSNASRFQLKSINQWGNIEWKSMESAFSNCFNVEYNVAIGDAPNLNDVTSMQSMFFNAKSFNGNLNDWNTINITDMSSMFSEADKFNGDISGWNTENVVDMRFMFSGASDFNGDISEWNTEKVTDMGFMFRLTNFDRDISQWNTSSVTNMESMFRIAENFNQDLSNWNIASLETANQMFRGSGMSPENYSATLIGWSEQDNIPFGVDFSGQNEMQYCNTPDVGVARDSLGDEGWNLGGDSPTDDCN